jgi:hypothetical protein
LYNFFCTQYVFNEALSIKTLFDATSGRATINGIQASAYTGELLLRAPFHPQNAKRASYLPK